ncbi:UNVERIFIED_CONTAM: hypothetical protein FKN15_036535 [Acipenser sinensis]
MDRCNSDSHQQASLSRFTTPPRDRSRVIISCAKLLVVPGDSTGSPALALGLLVRGKISMGGWPLSSRGCANISATCYILNGCIRSCGLIGFSLKCDTCSDQVSFWVVRELLTAQTLKIRAEILSHFVKLAKKLLELNNLHSLVSVVSALQSAPIFRLSKTWALINRKDKTAFDKLDYLLSKEENYSRMREYISTLKMVPTIPYLDHIVTLSTGYSRDLCLQQNSVAAVSLLNTSAAE